MNARWLGAMLAASLMTDVSSVHAASETPPPNYRPLANSDEAGIWLTSDKMEQAYRQSPLLVRDEQLTAYVSKIICDLAGPQCASLRIYVVDDPSFNAFCMPNGAVVVQTGLLLRAENEAQLAHVLGHELTHYLKRHSLNRSQARRDAAGIVTVLSLGQTRGLSLPEIIASGALASYSRDNEREADAGGFDLAAGLGYDPTQAAAIWANVKEEENAAPNRSTWSFFLDDHPAVEERLQTMKKHAAEIQSQTQAPVLRTEEYRAAVAPFRRQWLEEEINRGQYAESIVLMKRLAKNEPQAGELQYYLGEAYRRRNAKGDPENALAAYRAAIAGMGAPAAAHRSLGLVALKSGDKAAARDAFQQYLTLAPGASDRATVEYYLKTAGE